MRVVNGKSSFAGEGASNQPINTARPGKRRLTVLLDAAEDVVDVVGEEALCVEHGLDEAGDGAEGHVFCVCVSVPLRAG